jgi:hypothetical protein
VDSLRAKLHHALGAACKLSSLLLSAPSSCKDC